ncbi:MAG TPA: alpha/beta fold hydrolase [Solirubrobacterales bacterium]|nr:alpha/beta hydrolase [Solirubrobacterales bacterium]HMW44627.1 alpha/beta fold hydrolase [Solirubrobacterales bacterium]HMX71064.1 alpha/beta fold hydrolase [Solirubrobacterales bacterium]HMY24714.1 alpha/beta fold hydrolase [Solirubrobacterales bacterium]HNA43373.1 alpha/beta fold hydrolase [Solirubrobacterales bacterium]
MASFAPEEFTVEAGGRKLAGESQGEGPPILLCHGLSATRRYVVHGSRHLPRQGYRLITYDARGHGESDPAVRYDYEGLGGDLDLVIEANPAENGMVLGGHSMGCHTVARRALMDPRGVRALILIGPVFTGEADDDSRWDRRADALANGGPEAFAEIVAENSPNEEVREVTYRLARDRARLHRHPEAVAMALREVPRSLPFEGVNRLAALDLPVLVVASHDEFDPGHPRQVAELWAETIPGAELAGEEPGQSPLAWQGGLLSREIESFLGRHGLAAG